MVRSSMAEFARVLLGGLRYGPEALVRLGMLEFVTVC